ncbi:hypothetical protein C7Y66_17025 [Chroococcidiopsis sp. CCALA 051]|uniref:hypothetical protein n=1 Tax=Chroococcidiopsis sp. CCALA 051 TaxID=869949 RepID=UPI000D0DCD60|nr:hypothetical protein [Chroococcidiopsis sp. CCALA 051]MBE9015715.1 hypothetical protein [Chroococcidiopsidales cyanobacterium LEGE 13417]PSM47938.1 hypothetical protein C7Y66_17025 [Chroococcidiopsis sp. CCALA 051]
MKKLLLYSSICCLVTASGLTVNAETLSLVKQQAKTQIAAATAQPQVELLEVGNEPRQELRFRPQVNAKQTSTMTMNMDIEMSVAGRAAPKFALPATVITMDTLVTQIDANGDIHYKFSYSNVNVANAATLPPQTLEATRSQLKKMMGMGGSVIVDNRGYTKSAQLVIPKGLDPSMKQVTEQLSGSLDQISSPVPKEPIGIGAKWRVITFPQLRGAKVAQTATYQLVNLKNGIATFNVWVKQRVNDRALLNRPGMPNGNKMTLKSLDSQGEGQMMAALNQVIPIRSNLMMHSYSQLVIQQAGQAEANIDAKMTMKLNIQSK